MKNFKKLVICVLLSILFCGCGINENTDSKEVYIYLVRHGQTESNVKGMLVGGGGNYDLTEKGSKDALALGESLKGTKFVSVYSSPLGRAYDTAEYILEGANQREIEIQVVEGVRDIYWGDAEGYTAEEFVKEHGLTEFPEAFGNADDADFISPIHAESKYDFCNRFEETLMNIVEENKDNGGNVLVVAHSSMAFWLQQKFPEMNLEDLENTTVSIIRYDGDTWELMMYNNEVIH